MQILLTVAYDGTNYAGWQRQDNAVAVQEKIEGALAQLLAREVTLRAASRTDAGVHALGQRAAFFAPDLKIPTENLPLVLNSLLPEDISILAAESTCENFHPQFDAKQKKYIYNFYNAPLPNPLARKYSAFVSENLNFSDMQKAAKFFIGKHDFAAFCAKGSSAKTTVREIFFCSVEREKNFITLTVTGNGFLYNMVRIIAGTILYAGLGKIPHDSIPQIIAAKDRTKAGKTMPPQGLVLAEVMY
jgi:tRNA pseudouridine38-40 synthase